MELKFTKMHGTGNDFIVLDARDRAINLNQKQLRFLADRHFGIGADQILLIESADKSNLSDVDFSYRVFNADGSVAKQCGNGARCLAKYVYYNGINKKIICGAINSIKVIMHIQSNENVSVNMQSPIFDHDQIPFFPNDLASKKEHLETLYAFPVTDNKSQLAWFSILSMGNPHAVQIVPKIRAFSIKNTPTKTTKQCTNNVLAKKYRHNAFEQDISSIQSCSKVFPLGINVGYMEIINRQHILLRVWERGSGETLSCGTGACAAVISGIRRNLLNYNVRVDMAGGTLNVNWNNSESNAEVWLTGPAITVFTGNISVFN